MTDRAWQHLHVKRAIRSVRADRLTRGPSASVDRFLMASMKERNRIERADWFH